MKLFVATGAALLGLALGTPALAQVVPNTSGTATIGVGSASGTNPATGTVMSPGASTTLTPGVPSSVVTGTNSGTLTPAGVPVGPAGTLTGSRPVGSDPTIRTTSPRLSRDRTRAVSPATGTPR